MMKSCELCGKPFDSYMPNARFCCESCRRKAERKRHNAAGVLSVTYTCQWCGKEYHPKRSGRDKFCSRECFYASWMSVGKGDRAIRSMSDEPKRWIGDKKRRRIYERDGYRCHLCGYDTLTHHDCSDMRSPSLDHIEPRSLLGGDASVHDESNLMTAHIWCNTTRGTRPVTESLRREMRQSFESRFVLHPTE